MKLNLTVLIFLLISNINYSQFRNSDEKTVYSIDNASVSRIKLSGGETSLEYLLFDWDQYYNYFEPKSKEDISSIKYNGIFAKFGLTNMKKFVDIDEFDIETQGTIFGLTYLHSVNEIIDSSIGFFTWKLNFEVRKDNFMNYDPTTKKLLRKKPESYTISGGISRYMFNGCLVLAPTLYGSLSPKTYNSSGLTNFKSVNPLLITHGVIDFKDSDGRYGTIDNDICSGHIALSLPLFLLYNPSTQKPLVNLVPYGVSQFSSVTIPKYSLGISMGIFSGAIFDKNTPDKTIANKNKVKTIRSEYVFKAPSFISIGVDNHYSSNTKPSKPNFYLSGTISLN